jgi:DNA-binding NarL/FixJ family response regulator
MLDAMKVFLVDEHEVVRRGVRAILADTDGFEVVGEAPSIRSALARVPTLKPDVAVVGALFDVGTGVELCRELQSRHPPIAILMLTASGGEDVTLAAFLAGAAGVADKSITAAELVDAVRTVGAGNSLLDARAAGAILDRLRNPPVSTAPEDPFAALAPNERRVLEMLAQGRTNREIAEHLNYAEKTVKNYVSHILAKLGVTSRTQAALAFVVEQVEAR